MTISASKGGNKGELTNPLDDLLKVMLQATRS